ncbi:CRISPR system precrRNA processing endoribonuclease RAMP protein Cas6 [Tuwongella immobilis]|uniref:CRISPR-associated protein Cas6 C-terminal domain-containing protein n=1 Tax=Tuwongella immobilis TaxID=692036 RepID=A0A6C2YJF7_9BACT|nr:CRISPR system precrRNA processing endoribonuclease RAMP protein Cas6 [Tuwongella immobilis]VIP01253.1 Uncharacterized protein OS=Desulfobacca acetoxidans (strain ATCC 700848 / DSM 11109 / ASRB2) GN=Desac_1287 PE=4 SV=1 [Tuwongella immobilis]VTR97932.1 Uncharacterized protein OS=Desulfobacca acetoxidans (strain ATCC 700848 / DSM 11109 / ASRB2) GN=Desac_1287 PE=4 SV=1 [Tuwongella immobilis]
MLPILVQRLRFRFRTAGPLNPWMGPAVRGAVAKLWKDAVCQHPHAFRETQWTYCKGCPHQASCSYGMLMEPDPPAGVTVFTGQDDAIRPMVICPQYPLPSDARIGDFWQVRVTLIGQRAIAQAAEVPRWLEAAGRDPQRGLGPERIGFDLVDRDEHRTRMELPLRISDRVGVWPHLRVRLMTPLILRQTIDGKTRPILQPRFEDLLKASLRSVGRLHALYGTALPDATFAELKAAAASIVTRHAEFHERWQYQHSNRRQLGAQIRWISGWATYAQVPAALAEWLMWGGLLHSGTNRISGNGGWLVDASDSPAALPNDWHSPWPELAPLTDFGQANSVATQPPTSLHPPDDFASRNHRRHGRFALHTTRNRHSLGSPTTLAKSPDTKKPAWNPQRRESQAGE